jgi:hypothetical protein
MNFPRIAGAAIAAWVVDMLYGFFVYGTLMAPAFAAYPAVFRPPEEISIAPAALGSFVGFFAFAYVYAKGYEGGSGVQEGVRYGVLIGLMLVLFAVVWQYATTQISASLSLYMTIATLIEFVAAGAVVGFIYRPLAALPLPGSRNAPGSR